MVLTLDLFCDVLDAVQACVPGLADCIQLPDRAGELRLVNFVAPFAAHRCRMNEAGAIEDGPGAW